MPSRKEKIEKEAILGIFLPHQKRILPPRYPTKQFSGAAPGYNKIRHDKIM